MSPLDLSTFEAIGRREQRRPCKIGEALEKVKAADRKVADEGIRHENEAIRRGARRWLEQQAGVKISTASVGSHRNGTCTCP